MKIVLLLLLNKTIRVHSLTIGIQIYRISLGSINYHGRPTHHADQSIAAYVWSKSQA